MSVTKVLIDPRSPQVIDFLNLYIQDKNLRQETLLGWNRLNGKSVEALVRHNAMKNASSVDVIDGDCFILQLTVDCLGSRYEFSIVVILTRSKDELIPWKILGKPSVQPIT